jgi:hypothetical protein
MAASVVLFMIVTRGNDTGPYAVMATGAVSGLLFGIITGLPLAWLLRPLAPGTTV